MATIKATCPACGDVDLTPRQVEVLVVEAVDETLARRSYEFHCPGCQTLVEKPTDGDVVKLLASAGVRVTTVPLPAEARELHTGPTLSYDDLLDFALQLESQDLVAAMLETTGPR